MRYTMQLRQKVLVIKFNCLLLLLFTSLNRFLRIYSWYFEVLINSLNLGFTFSP